MNPLAICLTTFAGCLLGSFVPLVNTEVVVLTAAAAAPPALLLPIVLIATGTTMLAKSVLYLAGAGLLRLPRGRWSARVDVAIAQLERRRTASGALLFLSATTGFPPFYVTSIASGALHIAYRRFLLLGFIGRLLRYSALVALPLLVKAAIA